jgi:hypothetical protein
MIVASAMLTGIDKIALTTKEFSVKHTDLLVTKTTTGQGSQPAFLYKDKAGNEVWGNNSYHNTERMNMSISGYGMQVLVNPSKLFHPYELLTDVGKLQEVKSIIEQELQEVGVKADIEGAKMFRLDLAKQATMKQPVLMYAEAFRTVKAKRLTGRTYPNGFYFSNKGSELCFYDKGLEAKILGLHNFMRGEARFKKGEIVQKQTGLVTFSDLLRADADYLTNKYNNYLQDRVFKPANRPKQGILDFNEEGQFIQYLKAQYPRGWFKMWLLMGGIEQKVLGLGGLEGVRELLAKVEHRNNVGRHLNELTELLHMKGVYDADKGSLTSASMINEVRVMFAA